MSNFIEIRSFLTLALIQRKRASERARLRGELQALDEGISHFNTIINNIMLNGYLVIQGVSR